MSHGKYNTSTTLTPERLNFYCVFYCNHFPLHIVGWRKLRRLERTLNSTPQVTVISLHTLIVQECASHYSCPSITPPYLCRCDSCLERKSLSHSSPVDNKQRRWREEVCNNLTAINEGTSCSQTHRRHPETLRSKTDYWVQTKQSRYTERILHSHLVCCLWAVCHVYLWLVSTTTQYNLYSDAIVFRRGRSSLVTFLWIVTNLWLYFLNGGDACYSNLRSRPFPRGQITGTVSYPSTRV